MPPEVPAVATSSVPLEVTGLPVTVKTPDELPLLTVKPTLVTDPAGIAPPSASVIPSVPLNFARWFVVEEPGPMAHVAHAIVPDDVIVPPVIGEVVAMLVTVPLFAEVQPVEFPFASIPRA